MKRDYAKPFPQRGTKGKKKANRKKGENSPGSFGSLMAFVPWLARLSGVALLAFFCVFVHDGLTQTRFFKIKKVVTEGLENLERQEILLHAAIPERASLYGINLYHVRARLEAHPFVRKAKISRNLPAGLTIQVEEEKPFAILQPDFSNETIFLANAEGQVFKELENRPEAYGEYVVIHGLPLEGERENLFWFNKAKELLSLWNAEMEAPAGENPPISLRVDPDLGLYVERTEIARQIFFGRSDYSKKIAMLKELIAFQQLQNNTETNDRVDILGNNRIVLVPVQSESPPAT